MDFTGIYKKAWAGYEFLQWTGSVHHPGVDYNKGAGNADLGEKVIACGNGIVDYAKTSPGIGFGKHVFIKHQLMNGDIVYSHYAHLDTMTVSEGQEVGFGQKIGACGKSGGWDWAHLHFEIRKPINRGYNFWPKGYSAQWIAEHYYDPIYFIEQRSGGTMPDESNELQECLAAHSHLMNEIKKKDEEYKNLKEDLSREVAAGKTRKDQYEKFLRELSTKLGPEVDTKESNILAGLDKFIGLEDENRKLKKQLEEAKENGEIIIKDEKHSRICILLAKIGL